MMSPSLPPLLRACSQGHPGNNYPLRSEKFSYFEGGIRVPAFVYAPGLIPKSRVGTTYHGLMHHVDLTTTFVALAGFGGGRWRPRASIVAPSTLIPRLSVTRRRVPK